MTLCQSCGDEATVRVRATYPSRGQTVTEFDEQQCDSCAAWTRKHYNDRCYDVAVTPLETLDAKAQEADEMRVEVSE